MLANKRGTNVCRCRRPDSRGCCRAMAKHRCISMARLAPFLDSHGSGSTPQHRCVRIDLGRKSPSHIQFLGQLVARPGLDMRKSRYNPADHPTVIDARLTARVGGKIRYQTLELLVSQPEMHSFHQRGLPSETLNQKSVRAGIRFMPSPDEGDSLRDSLTRC